MRDRITSPYRDRYKEIIEHLESNMSAQQEIVHRQHVIVHGASISLSDYEMGHLSILQSERECLLDELKELKEKRSDDKN